ncbi:MAG: DUF3494 domain-containing protein [Deltaproteobacteria bacterium]|nr:MAG: DUF3494 domain-containing protein [Deltaproteobacteria bacterium]
MRTIQRTLVVLLLTAGCGSQLVEFGGGQGGPDGGVDGGVGAPPRVIARNPLDNAKGTCSNTKVTATFDGPMDPLTIVGANFTLTSPPAVTVNGTVTYDAANHAAVFTPTANLALSTLFTATITTGVKSDDGVALAANDVWTFTTGAAACQLPVNLRSLVSFVAVAGAGLTNSNSAGVTVLGGDVGLSPTATCTSDGSPCNPAAGAPKITGTLYANDPAGKAAAAKADLVSAYNDAAGRPPGTVAADLSGMVLAPGVYTSGSTMMIAVNGTLVLDGQGDSNAVWIFQLGSALTVNNGAKVFLVNGAKAANVFWAIGSSSTLGGGVSFKGTILAQSSNSVGTASAVEGRLLCTTGQITLLSDTITLPAP